MLHSFVLFCFLLFPLYCVVCYDTSVCMYVFDICYCTTCMNKDDDDDDDQLPVASHYTLLR